METIYYPTKEEVVKKLENAASKFTYIDISGGAEKHLNTSRKIFNAAISDLREKGYNIYQINIKHLPRLYINSESKTIKILTKQDIRIADVFATVDAGLLTYTCYTYKF